MSVLPAGRFCTQAYTVCACGPLRGCGGFCLVLHPLSVKVRECVESEYGLSPSHLVLAWGTIQEAWPSKCHLRMSARGWKWIVVSLTSCCFPSHCLQLTWVVAVQRERLCPRVIAASFSVPYGFSANARKITSETALRHLGTACGTASARDAFPPKIERRHIERFENGELKDETEDVFVVDHLLEHRLLRP